MTTKEEFEKMWNERNILNKSTWFILLTVGGSVYADSVRFDNNLVKIHHNGQGTAYIPYSIIMEVI
jgi:hypothetical protein